MAAPINWNNGTGNRHWEVGGNWAGGQVPYVSLYGVHQDDAQIVLNSNNAVIYDANDNAGDSNELPRYVFFIVVGYNSGNSGEMWMNGGSLYAPWGLHLNKYGSASSNSKLHIKGGLLHLGPWPDYTGAAWQGNIQVGRTAGIADCNMTGGTVECMGLQIPGTGANVGTTGTFELNGGVISVNTAPPTESLDIGTKAGTTGKLYITKGRMILKGDKRTRVNGYIDVGNPDNGKIIPYPGQTGRRVVNVDYGNLSDANTTVTASLTELTQAWKPVPVDAQPNVRKSATLCWKPGDEAVSHDLYLGVDFDDVNNATEPLVTTDVNSYTPNSLVCGQTYYWRVDECNDPNTYKGQVWSFTVSYNPLASEPSPVNGATGVNPNADLGWTAGDTATAHDVYFGTSFADVNSVNNYNEPLGRGRRTTTSYEPGALTLGRKYYWRIDEFDGSTVQRGDIWGFEVVSGIASQPQPVDGKRFVGTDVILRWSAGYGALSHDVYFGTNFNDVNNASVPLITITTTDYALVGLELGKTYYWRIDEDDGGTTRKGYVWQFATEPAGSVRAFPGAEGYGAYSLGGRGGDVYHVTNLTDDATNPQPGSLRYGINTATGPRTIVFDVSGYIELQNRLEITKSHLTLAGQTAPGLGITIRKNDIRIYDTNNVIARYFRVRTGYYQSGQNTHPHGYLDLDNLSVEGGQDIILDHISTSWSRDECMSVGGDSNNVTVQWCTLTEPLNYDEHSKASLLRTAMSARLTHHHNLYADIMKRVTRFGNWNDNVVTRYDWYNNVVFNWGPESTYSYDNTNTWNYVSRGGGSAGSDGEFVKINFMDNYFIAGPTTGIFTAYNGANAAHDEIWASGIITDFDLDPNHNGVNAGWGAISGNYMKMSGAFAIESPYTFEDAGTAYQKVLARAGACLVRDAVDERIVSDVNAREGSIPDTQDDVGGWPAIAEVHRSADFDTDGDGMPNAYETARGLDPNDPADRNIVGDDGYTNLEKYLNYLVLWRSTLKGDFNTDGRINFVDLDTFIGEWLLYDPTFLPTADLNGDGYVNWYDFAIFTQNWDD